MKWNDIICFWRGHKWTCFYETENNPCKQIRSCNRCNTVDQRESHHFNEFDSWKVIDHRKDLDSFVLKFNSADIPYAERNSEMIYHCAERICLNCGYIEFKDEHDWSESEETGIRSGYISRHCKKCGLKQNDFDNEMEQSMWDSYH